jgi:hypothetical protein
VYYGPWIPAAAFGEPNKKPEFAQASSSIVLPYSQVNNATQVGTWVATDPDGDELQYSVSSQPIIADRFLKNANPQSAVRPFVSIDKTTGVVTIRNAAELRQAYRRDFRFDVVIAAFDGKERAFQTVTLYDDYSSYTRAATDYINSWESVANQQITEHSVRLVDAFDKLNEFGGELRHFESLVDTSSTTVLTFALFVAPEVTAMEVALGLASYGVHILAGVADDVTDTSNEAIMTALRDKASDIRADDRKRIENTAIEERRRLNEFIDEVSRKDQFGKFILPPDMQARRSYEYLEAIKQRLVKPLEAQLPKVDDLYCLLLVEYARVSNCSLYGSMMAQKQHGEFWGSSDFNGAGCNGYDIMTELNRLNYVPPRGGFVKIKRR